MDINDLESLGELGHGTCGHVVKMRHRPSNFLMAVKVSPLEVLNKAFTSFAQVILVNAVNVIATAIKNNLHSNGVGLVFRRSKWRS